VATEPINIPIQTSYDDQGAKDALQDAEKLEDLDPEVVIEADASHAVDGFDDVTQSAKDLMDRNPWVAELLADTTAAKGDIESLQGKLKETGDVADDAKRHLDKVGGTEGPRLAGNQVADLTGPLGDASGAASNLGGVFDGLADITEKVAGKVGLDAAKMAGAVSGIGFAVAAAAAVWTIFRQKQAEAKKKAEEHLKLQGELNDAIAEGNRKVAASKFLELYGDIIDKGTEAGLTVEEVVAQIRGTGDASESAGRKVSDLDDEIADLTARYGELHTKTQASGEAATEEEKKLGNLITKRRDERDALVDAKDQYANLTAEQQESIDKNKDVADALLGTTQELDDTAAAADRAKQKAEDLNAAFDDLRGAMDFDRTAEDLQTALTDAMNNIALGVAPTKEEIRSIEDSIIEVAEMAGKTPIEVKSELQKVASGDLFSVRNDVQSWMNEHAIQVQFEIANDALSKIRSGFSKFGVTIPVIPVAGKTAAASTTVNVNLPRGARHGDIARSLGMSTRRNGRRYGNPSGTVSYARR
jgi:phage host-nuclease inhibitor protein Gam